MTEEISSKNTKNEILEAYQEALKQLKDAKRSTKQEEKAIEEKKEIVLTASNQTTDTIFKNISELKFSLVNALEDIEEKLLTSRKTLTTLQQAIDIQTKELAELHEIKVNADTLAALLSAQKEKSLFFEKDIIERQQQFDQDMSQKRMIWKKEQEEYEAVKKDTETQTKKTRQREEDEYLYQRDLLRQKDNDQYIAKKDAQEKELINKRMELEQEFQQRAEKLVSEEREFALLKEKAEKFPEELQKAIEDTTNTITERLSFKFDYETKLAQKEVEGDRKLHQQMISALEAKVAQLEAQLKQMADKTNQANLQVQDIAVKAIEGASRQRIANAYHERPLEQSKTQ